MEYFSNEFFLIALTFGSYFVGKLLRRLTGWVIMNPILVSIVCIIAFLKITGVSYETYNKGGHMIEFWLRPAVVALGVPLYMQLSTIKKQLTPILLSELAGCVVGVVSVVWIAKEMGAARGDPVACVQVCHNAHCHGGDQGCGWHSVAHGCCSGGCRAAVCRMWLSHNGFRTRQESRGTGPVYGHGGSRPWHSHVDGPQSGARCLRQPRTHAQRHIHVAPHPVDIAALRGLMSFEC